MTKFKAITAVAALFLGALAAYVWAVVGAWVRITSVE